MTLTDTHLVILSAAAARADLLVPSTVKLRGNLRTASRSLVEAGYVEVVPVTRDDPAHDTDDDRHPTGLRITPAGLSAIGLGAAANGDGGTEIAAGVDADAPPPVRRSKRDRVVDLLRRSEGAALDELIAETNGLPHTVRAALSGLRKSGLAVTRTSDEQGQSRYRIVIPPAADAATATELTAEV